MKTHCATESEGLVKTKGGQKTRQRKSLLWYVNRACERSVSGDKAAHASVTLALRSVTSRSALCSAPSFFCNALPPLRSTQFWLAPLRSDKSVKLIGLRIGKL